jgi:hypothetical protein
MMSAWAGIGVAFCAELPPANDSLFQAEMRLAGSAADRDSRVEHWKKALSYRPDDPDNIVIEYKIAVALSQVTDPAHGQGLRRVEGLVFFKRIADGYDHMRYYSPEPSDSIDSPQFMVPRAAVHAASILWGQRGTSEDARKYLKVAMKDIGATYRKRIDDWSHEPPPRIEDSEELGGKEKAEAALALWNRRQEAAKRGDVLSSQEIVVAKEAVRQFGYTYGRQRPYEVGGPMRQIIEEFPNTPMARFAREHIEQAGKLTTREADEEIGRSLQNLLPGKAPSRSRPSSGKALAATRPLDEPIAQLPRGDPSATRGAPVFWLWGAGGICIAAVLFLRVALRRGPPAK